ncbi:MAG TPA: inorganic diphosphatase [Candidatus Paceibacterota bacterium]|nr:inorganic diphosphatase [Candidatus Paceibacterota bacterium]
MSNNQSDEMRPASNGMNLWHDVPLGDKVPEEFNTIIEIPKGSNNKYEIDKKTGLIALDRANYSNAPYPVDYGFAPQTLWEDNDALDVIVLSTFPIQVGVLVKVRPVAMMEMVDDGESDCKIIAVPVKDRRWEDVNDLKDINKHTIREIQHFFETYKKLKGDDNVVTIGEVKGKDAATEAVLKSIQIYKEKFSK